MASDNEIGISVTVDSSGLQTGLGRAQAALGGLSQSAGRAGAALADVGGLGGRAATDIGRMSGALGGAAPAASLAGQELARVSAGMEHAGGQAGIFREKMVLLHELFMGSTSRMAGSMMVLTERTGSLGGAIGTLLNPATLAMGALVALGGSAVMATVRQEHLQQSLARIDGSLRATGASARFGADAWSGYIASLERVEGVDRATAQQIATDWSRIADIGPNQIGRMIGALHDMAEVTGTEAPEAARRLAQGLADPIKMLEDLHQATGQDVTLQQEEVRQALQVADVMRARQLALDAVANGYRQAAGEETAFQRATERARAALHELGDALSQDEGGSHALAEAMSGVADLLEALKTPIAVAGGALRDMGDIAVAAAHAGGAALGYLNEVAATAAASITNLGVATAQALMGNLSGATQTLTDMPGRVSQAFSKAAAETQGHLAKMREALDDTMKFHLPTERPGGAGGAGASLGATTPDAGGGATVDREAAKVRGGHAGDGEQIKELDRQVAVLNDSLSRAKTTLESLAATKGPDSAEWKAQKSLIDQDAASLKKLGEEKARALQAGDAIAQGHAQTEIEISRVAYGEKKRLLDEQVKTGQMAAAEAVRQEKTMLSALAQQDEALLTAKQRGYEEDSAEFQRLADQKRLIQAKLQGDMAALDQGASQGRQTGAASPMQSWRAELADQEAASQASRVQMLQGEIAFWEGKKQLARSGTAVAVEVEREAARARIALAHEEAAEVRRAREEALEISRGHAQTEVEIDKTELVTHRQMLREGVLEGAITAAQKIEIEKDLTRAVILEEMDRLSAEQQAYAEQSKEYQSLADQKRKIQAGLDQSLSALDREAAQQQRQSALAVQHAWEGIAQPISQALTQGLDGLLQHSQSAGHALVQILRSTIMGGINGLVHDAVSGVAGMVANSEVGKSIIGGQGAGQDAGQKGGDGKSQETTAFSLLSAAIRALVTATGAHTVATAGNTAATAGNTGAQVVGAAATDINTGATEVNAMATELNAATQEVGIAAILGNTIATSANTIWTMILSIVDAIPKFATGAWELPGDMVAQVHQGEMIIPARAAEAVRRTGMLPGTHAASHTAAETLRQTGAPSGRVLGLPSALSMPGAGRLGDVAPMGNSTINLHYAPSHTAHGRGGLSADEARTFFRDHGDLLLDALKRVHKNGSLRG